MHEWLNLIQDYYLNRKCKADYTIYIYIYIYIRKFAGYSVQVYDVSSSKATRRISNWIAVVAIASIERIASMRSLAPFLMWVNVCVCELKMIRCTGSDVMTSQLLGRWSTRRARGATTRTRVFTSSANTKFVVKLCSEK